MKIWLRTKSAGFSSWVVVWQKLAEALAKQGHEVAPYPFALPKEWNAADVVEIWWGDPATWNWSMDNPLLRVGIALSEARSIQSKGKEAALANLRRCALLICPSEHASSAYREAPLDVPISVVLFGADTEEFSFVERDWAEELCFLHLGITQYRKGSWLVPESFRKAFGQDEDVRLVISCPRKKSPMFASLKREYGWDGRIRFSEDFVSSSFEAYSQSHVLVASHLAEGFGLCILEAMATGMPCLVSRCSAPLEFFKADYGWWVEMSELYAPVAWCLENTSGFWRLPDVGDLAVKMRLAYENREQCQQKGLAGAQYVRSSLTWTHTARAIIELLEGRLL